MSVATSGKITSTTKPRDPARAEIVGSLLRPRQLQDKVAEIYEPGHTALLDEERGKDLSALHKLEDELIHDAVRRQVDAGLDVVSDGEFRRYMFTGSFYDAFTGFRKGGGQVPFRDENGNVEYYTGVPLAERRIETIGTPGADEVRFLKSIVDHPFKITFPAASFFWLPFLWVPGVTDKAYDNQQEMVEHMIELEKEQISAAVAAGADYIQLDFPLFPLLVDDFAVEQIKSLGTDVDWLLDRAVEADTRIVEAIPSDVRRGLHLCRGNWRSRWIYEGSIEPVAERMFQLPYDVFLIEWEETWREGSYDALRFVPKGGPIVAMGVMSTKKPRVESADELVGHIEEASRFLDIEQLALGPQCGFASALQGNEISEETQWRKIDVLVEAADRIWPRS
jgi:5-methyltetrahydropteroyltriglutamate--homocysteine methyltransferase